MHAGWPKTASPKSEGVMDGCRLAIGVPFAVPQFFYFIKSSISLNPSPPAIILLYLSFEQCSTVG